MAALVRRCCEESERAGLGVEAGAASSRATGSRSRSRRRERDNFDNVPGGYMASDGREVVAAWTTYSRSRVGKFRFTGTGLSGLLGEKWAIAAIVTFCALI